MICSYCGDKTSWGFREFDYKPCDSHRIKITLSFEYCPVYKMIVTSDIEVGEYA